MEAIGGWLLFYLIGSIPVSFFHAAGVAGRFFDYHAGALAGAFLVLVAPLALVVSREASAPSWNIAALWLGAASTSLILAQGVISADQARRSEVAPMVAVIVLVSLGWAAIWTAYFLKSDRVARTLGLLDL